MSGAARTAVPVAGIIFLALAVVKLLKGEDWIVWAILAFLLGGFGVFSLRKSEGGQ